MVYGKSPARVNQADRLPKPYLWFILQTIAIQLLATKMSSSTERLEALGLTRERLEKLAYGNVETRFGLAYAILLHDPDTLLDAFRKVARRPAQGPRRDTAPKQDR
jgi:hypothetical protein